MSATQIDIAKAIGMDVSTVNKILNNVQGPKFTAATRKLVIRTAKQLGYNFERINKGKLRQILEDLFPSGVGVDVLASTRGVTLEKVLEIREIIRRAGGAA